MATAEQIVLANEDDNGTNLHWARILAAHLFEAAKFLRRGSSLAASKMLLGRLPAERQADFHALEDAEFLKGALAYDRNLTFHYPTVSCEDAKHGGPQLVIAMDAVRDHEPELFVQYDKDGQPKGYRYRFADSVAAEFAMANFGASEKEQKAAILKVQELAFAFGRFADAIFYEWGQGRGLSLGEPQPIPSQEAGS